MASWQPIARSSALQPASPQASSIETLWWVFFWVAALVLALVVVATLAALFRRRASSDAGPVVHPGREQALQVVTGSAAVVTLLVLVVLLVASVRTGHALARTAADPLKIKIIGQRWWWQVEYPDVHPSRNVITANEVHVPVGRPVELELSSRDVIHSLWVPALQGKRDLIPGKDATLHFLVSESGVYRGQCAEFCGLQHAHMGLLVVAEEAPRFEAWLAAQRAPATEPGAERERRGRDVFLSSACPLCHSVSGTPAAGNVGPDLTHVASRSSLAAGTLANDDEHLRRWVLDPQGAKLGTLMPPNPLKPEDLDALLAFVRSLR